MVQRCGPSREAQASAVLVAGFPREIDTWKVESEEPLSPGAVRMLQCAGYVNRVYTDQSTGESVKVVVMVGPAGPLSVHTPEICYRSTNYEIQQPRQTISIPGDRSTPHTFSTVTFEVNDASSRHLRVYYAWSDGNGWIAPSQPRFYFAGKSLLYKVQVATQTSDSHNGGIDPGLRFIHSALPYLEKCTESQAG
jgi:hypothetical protein